MEKELVYISCWLYLLMIDGRNQLVVVPSVFVYLPRALVLISTNYVLHDITSPYIPRLFQKFFVIQEMFPIWNWLILACVIYLLVDLVATVTSHIISKTPDSRLLRLHSTCMVDIWCIITIKNGLFLCITYIILDCCGFLTFDLYICSYDDSLPDTIHLLYTLFTSRVYLIMCIYNESLRYIEIWYVHNT